MNFPEENNNLADSMAVLKYIHTEVIVEHAANPIRTERKYGIDSVQHHRYKVRNPVGLEAGPDPYRFFGPFVAYDSGVANGGDLPAELLKFGDYVGAQGQEGDTRFGWPSDKRPYWFSVGNWCPNLPFGQKGTKEKPNKNCTKIDGEYVLGGLCNKGGGGDKIEPAVTPSGKRGCVYSYGKATVVKLDVLVGITEEDCGKRKCKDWADFREHCTNSSYKRKYNTNGDIEIVDKCIEYDIHPDCFDTCHSASCTSRSTPELGLPFWAGRCSETSNIQRRDAVEKLLNHKMLEHVLLV